MDDDPTWLLLEPGVLVHVDGELAITRRELLPGPPKHQLSLSDLSPTAAASQRASIG
jgi:glutamine amidotransferase